MIFSDEKKIGLRKFKADGFSASHDNVFQFGGKYYVPEVDPEGVHDPIFFQNYKNLCQKSSIPRFHPTRITALDPPLPLCSKHWLYKFL